MVADCRGAPPQEHGQPANHIRVKVGGQKTLEKESVVDPVKGLRQVCSGDHSATWGFALVKAPRNGSGDGKEGGDG